MQLDSRRSGQRTFLATCALVSSLVMGAGLAARAQQTPPAPVSGETLVTMDVRDAGLSDAVRMLSASNGLDNIVVQKPKGRDFNLISMRLTDKPLKVVLNALATAAGATLQERDGIYYLLPPEEAAANPVTPPVPAPAPAAPVVKPKANRQWTKIRLNYILPSVCQAIIEDPKWTPILEAPINPINVTPVPNSAMDKLIDSNRSNSAPAGAAGSGAGRDSGSLDSAGARGQGIGGGRGGGGFGGGGQGFGGGQGGFGGGQGAGGQAGGGSLRPQGITNIISSDSSNSLLVEYDGDVADVERLRELVRLLDVAPQQVQVRVEFVSVNLADADSFGVDWRFSPAGNLDVQIPPANSTTPTITLAYASGNAVANLRAAMTRTTQNVFQAPIITTLNNAPGFINFTNQVSVPQATNIVNNNGIVTGNNFVTFTATNGIAVTPHINGDGSITMSLNPQLSSVQPAADGSIQGTTQQIQTIRRVQNGETMVLGGFITKQYTDSKVKVPLLGDLPIIGSLFTQRNRAQTGAETLVFVTPTIIEDRSQGSVGTLGSSSAVAAPTP